MEKVMAKRDFKRLKRRHAVDGSLPRWTIGEAKNALYVPSFLALDHSQWPAERSEAFAVAFPCWTKHVEWNRSHRLISGLDPKNSNASTRRLRDAAFEAVLKNLTAIDDLTCLPPHLSRRIWATLELRGQVSFHAWRLLSQALNREIDPTLGLFYYQERAAWNECAPSSFCPFTDFTKALTSSSFDFIAALTISDPYGLELRDLVKISSMSNLGILEIFSHTGEVKSTVGIPLFAKSGPTAVDDFLIRTWSREAVNNKRFPVLRIMRLSNHSNITENCLQDFQAFPALGIFDVRGCGIRNVDEALSQAKTLGWLPVLHDKALSFLETKCKEQGTGLREGWRRPTTAMWPGEVVERVERLKINQHLAQFYQSVSTSGKGLSKPEKKDTIEPDPVGMRWKQVDQMLFATARGEKLPDFHNMACWARLGELRGDEDLLRAGVKGIEKLAVVKDQIVSPVPMAYITLGSGGPAQVDSSLPLVFIRLSIAPQQEENKKREQAGPIERKLTKKPKLVLRNLLQEFGIG